MLFFSPIILRGTPNAISIDRAWSYFASCALLVATACYGYRDQPQRRFLLDDERSIVAGILESVETGGTVAAFNADPIYVLSDWRSPYPFVRLNFNRFFHMAGVDGGCNGLLRRLVADRPNLIVIGRARGACRSIVQGLSDEGFEREDIEVGWGAWTVFRP